MDSKSEQHNDAAIMAYFELYGSLSTKVSAWFVAYGAGFIMLVLSSDSLLQLIQQSNHGLLILVLMLGGAIVQALRALLYKWVVLARYLSEVEPILSARPLYRFCMELLESPWFDLLFDVSTLAVYAIGTYFALILLF